LKTEKTSKLFSAKLSIVTMACDHNLIAVIDKGLNITIYSFANKDFKC